MARDRTSNEYGKFINKEHERVTPNRGTPYPCTQQQIDAYTLKHFCSRGNDHVLSEGDATSMLEKFLDPFCPPTPKVRTALHRIADAMYIRDDWYSDLILKAVHDIDTAFFMGRLEGNVRVQWISQIRIVQELGDGAAHTLGSTHYLGHGCSSVWLSTRAIFKEADFPRRRMWQVLFHELIVSPQSLHSELRQHANLKCKHAYAFTMCHNAPHGSYDRAKGWSGGHGYMFRRCLRAVEERTKEYFEGLRIASAEDVTDYHTLH